MYKIKFSLNLKGNYHVSAGYGAGAKCDSLLLKDDYGAPIIKGTTLCGLLRDGAEKLFKTLILKNPNQSYHEEGDYCRADGQCPVCAIFGSPRQAKSFFISDANAVSNRKKIKNEFSKTELEYIHRRMSMNLRTKRNDEHKLYSIEEGCNKEFEFCVECPSIAQATFLVAAARMVRGLGAARRRGLGECLFKAETNPPEPYNDWQDAFEKLWLCRKIPDLKTDFQQCFSVQSSIEDGSEIKTEIKTESLATKHYKIWLTVELTGQVVLANRSTAGNGFETLRHIPGNVVKGALAAKIGKIAPDELNYQQFLELFCQDKVLYSSLYLSHKDSIIDGDTFTPAIPVPLDVLVCKYNNPWEWAVSRNRKNHTCRSLTNQSDNSSLTCICGADLRELSGMVLPLKDGAQIREVTSKIQMHNKITNSKGTVLQGALYYYNAISEKQWFIGEISCGSKNDWQRICALAKLPSEGKSFDLRLGKAIRRGYGLVKASWHEASSGDTIWCNLPLENRVELSPESKNQVSVNMLLLSECILRDEWGRYLTGLDEQNALELNLQEALYHAGWAGESKKLKVIAIETSSNKHRIIDSFNTYLGIPYSRDMVILAGSAVKLILKLEDSSTIKSDRTILAALSVLEQTGIGLKRGSGYGKIAFNHPIYQDAALNIQADTLYEKISEGILLPSIDKSPGTEMIESAGSIRTAFQKDINDWVGKLIKSSKYGNWENTFSADSGVAAVWRLATRHINHFSYKLNQVNSINEIKEFLFKQLENPKQNTELFQNNKIPASEKKPFFADPAKGEPGMILIKTVLDKALSSRSDIWETQAYKIEYGDLNETEKATIVLQVLTQAIGELTGKEDAKR